MKKDSLIRTIYLYIFTLLGLALLVVGGVILLDLGLKAFVFKKADVDSFSQPPRTISLYPGKTIEEEDFISAVEKCEEKCELTEEQKEQIDNWLADYKFWKEQQSKISYTTQRRHRQASQALALLIIGLPLYLFHWGVIKKEIKKEA